MKKVILPLLLSALCFAAQGRDYTLASPDGTVKATVSDKLDYTVSFNGKALFTGSAAIELENGKTVSTAKAPKTKSVDATVMSPLYRATSIADRYNQLTLTADKDWKIEFRTYDDGVAYRWVYTGKKPVNVVDEKVAYTFVDDAKPPSDISVPTAAQASRHSSSAPSRTNTSKQLFQNSTPSGWLSCP